MLAPSTPDAAPAATCDPFVAAFVRDWSLTFVRSGNRQPCPLCGSSAWQTHVQGDLTVTACAVCGYEADVEILPF